MRYFLVKTIIVPLSLAFGLPLVSLVFAAEKTKIDVVSGYIVLQDKKDRIIGEDAYKRCNYNAMVQITKPDGVIAVWPEKPIVATTGSFCVEIEHNNITRAILIDGACEGFYVVPEDQNEIGRIINLNTSGPYNNKEVIFRTAQNAASRVFRYCDNEINDIAEKKRCIENALNYYGSHLPSLVTLADIAYRQGDYSVCQKIYNKLATSASDEKVKNEVLSIGCQENLNLKGEKDWNSLLKITLDTALSYNNDEINDRTRVRLVQLLIDAFTNSYRPDANLSELEKHYNVTQNIQDEWHAIVEFSRPIINRKLTCKTGVSNFKCEYVKISKTLSCGRKVYNSLLNDRRGKCGE
jgi:hypothetical protein